MKKLQQKTESTKLGISAMDVTVTSIDVKKFNSEKNNLEALKNRNCSILLPEHDVEARLSASKISVSSYKNSSGVNLPIVSVGLPRIQQNSISLPIQRQ